MEIDLLPVCQGQNRTVPARRNVILRCPLDTVCFPALGKVKIKRNGHRYDQDRCRNPDERRTPCTRSFYYSGVTAMLADVAEHRFPNYFFLPCVKLLDLLDRTSLLVLFLYH